MLKVLYYNRETILKNIAESLVISGFPKSTKEYTPEGLAHEIDSLYRTLFTMDSRQRENMPISEAMWEKVEPYLRRGKYLGRAIPNSGHDCYLKGVTFNMIINAPSYWYPQYQRYHFTDIISSQSKMHKLTEMDLNSQCTVDVDARVIGILNKYIEKFNNATDKETKDTLFKQIVANTPMGLTLTCGITMNYLQIKSMVGQREHHKIDEWCKDFVDFANELPLFNTLTKKESKENN